MNQAPAADHGPSPHARPASIVSPTLLGQPVLTALLAVPLLNESIGWAQVTGRALVLAGIWFINRPRTPPA